MSSRAASARARLRDLVGDVPRAAWICTLVALLNAVAWSLLTPAFQIPDETTHFAYVEYLAHTGQPPIAGPRDALSSSEATLLHDLRFEQIAFKRHNGTSWTDLDQQRTTRDLLRNEPRDDGNGGAAAVGGEPPLFYALQTVPYGLASGGTVLDQLALMRLLSALLGALAVLFVYLFLREALPGVPWTWTVGALGVAFNPLLGFMAGGVNSDALLYTASAATFWLLARGFRHGLTRSIAIAAGAAMAVGLLTKYNFAGLVPGAAVGLLLLAVRREGGLRLETLRLPALALAIALAPTLLEMALNATIWNRPVVGATTSAFGPFDAHGTVGGALSYIWQLYLVPLPGMTHLIADVSLPLRDLWITGLIGEFGMGDTTFRQWVHDVALLPLAAILLLAGRALATQRAEIRRRREELAVYVLLAACFLVYVGLASYLIFLHFNQNLALSRYLLPLLPLYGALLVLAARGAGRWMTVAGTSIVLLAVTHSIFSQLLLISRYYA